METRVKLKFGIILIFVIFWNSVDVCLGVDGNVTDPTVADNTTTTTDNPTNTDYCVDNNCENSAVCVSGDGNYTCTCTEGWEGWLCNEDKNDCLSTPCQNGGVCSDNGTNSFVCNCTIGWMGDTCTEDVNECKDEPCVNGECLQDEGTGNFSCACPVDYQGLLCDQMIDDCDPDPCKNGGNCTDEVGNYTCSCPSGFQGKNCEQDVLECSESPCQNGGYCQELFGTYKCHCGETWSGDNCTEDYDECTVGLKCQGQGFNCTNTNGSYLCECSHGYRKMNDKCIEIVMIPDKTDGSIQQITMTNTVHRLHTPSIPYYSQLYISLFISTNGYITFGERFEQSYPPSNLSDWSDAGKYKLLAPYWWMNDIPDTQNSSVVISEYSSEVMSDNDDLEMFSKIIRSHDATKLMFAAEYVVMVTWHQFTPFPASINRDKLSITFQLAYITNGKQAYSVMNYDKLWPHSEDRSVASIFTGSGTEQIQQLTPEEYTRLVIPLFDNDAELENPDLECRKNLAKYTEYYKKMSGDGMVLMKDPGTCPCGLDQAELDLQFEMDSEDTKQKCFKQVFFQENNEKQLCCYEKVSGSLNILQSGHGYGMPKNTTIADLVKSTRTICCGEKSSSCSTFTSTVRISSCKNFQVKTGIIFGDPHFHTIDGTRFTFNGRGEYSLLKSVYHDKKLDIQIRTGLVQVTGGETGEATQIIGIALTYQDSANLEFMIDASELKFYMDGLEQTSDIMNDAMMVKKMDKDYVIILDNGQSMKIQPTMDHMTFTLFGKFNDTTGLLGVTNGNMADDFLFSNGTVLSHDAKEEELFEFGQSWLVAMEEKSLFNYTLIDGNFSTNQFPAFTPVFYRDKIGNLTELFDGDEAMVNASAAKCGDHVACLIDYAATKNPDFADSTKMIDEKFMADKMKLENNPPSYMAEYYLRNLTYVKYGDNFNMKFEFMDTAEFNVTIETNLMEADWSLSDENVFSANSTLITSDFFVRATAENKHGMKSVNQPLPRFCFCQTEMQCVQNGDNIIDKCDCPSDQTGDYCQLEQVDVCSKCFNKALCNISNTDSPCDCPEGLMGDGVNCYDVDECLTGNNECDQVCSNTIGNYTCSCRHGYELYGMGTCIDIDECATSSKNNCTSSEYCINEPGGFTCPCRTMFKRDENHMCVKVVALYGGMIVFASLPGNSQTWSPQLEDKTSTEFKQLSQKVESSIKETLEKNQELKDSLMKISVVKFMMKSDSGASRKKRAAESTTIEAEYEVAFDKEIPEKTLQDSIKEGFQACTASTCMFGSLIGVDKNSTTLSSNYDLCETDNNICQKISTTCQSSSGTYTCHCRQGYEKWNQFTHACQDIDECLVTVGNKTALQEMCGGQGLKCNNEPGTYSCQCTSDYSYNKDTKCTLTNYCNSEPCKNGAKCENVWGEAKYACKCNYGYTGVNCQDEDAEAAKQRTIIIAVSATLGVICFILLLVLVLICTKRKKSSHHASINMEEYSSFKGIPRASLNGQDNPMMENGSTHSSNDLDIQVQKKQTGGGPTTIFNHQLFERRESNPSSSDDHLRIYADPDVPLYIDRP